MRGLDERLAGANSGAAGTRLSCLQPCLKPGTLRKRSASAVTNSEQVSESPSLATEKNLKYDGLFVGARHPSKARLTLTLLTAKTCEHHIVPQRQSHG